jgi:hypothetical protein
VSFFFKAAMQETAHKVVAGTALAVRAASGMNRRFNQFF